MYEVGLFYMFQNAVICYGVLVGVVKNKVNILKKIRKIMTK